VAIPLALLLSTVLPNNNKTSSPRVIVVDLKKESLELLHRRAQEALIPYQPCNEHHRHPSFVTQKNSLPQSTAISNLFSFHGDIVAYSQTTTTTTNSFHIGMALHACGEATDIALRLCLQQKAAFILAPCCIGKLSTQSHNPYVFQATNQNSPTISYPQSRYYTRELIVTQDEFNSLAKAADYSNPFTTFEKMTQQQSPQEANAIRRIAKTCVEWDRLCFAKETVPNYTILLTKMNPITSSPKNDILIGWIENHSTTTNGAEILSENNNRIAASTAGKRDIFWAMQHLNLKVQATRFLPSIQKDANEKLHGNHISNDCCTTKTTQDHNNCSTVFETTSSSRMEWSYEEETSITEQIESFRCSTQLEYSFPPGQGSRMRKLIHHVAEIHGLSHRSLGKQNSKRYVIVTKKLI